MYTFPGTTWGTYVDATDVNLDPASDFGGVALSTVAVITITARVQESLTFCVTSADADDWDDTANAGANIGSCSADEVAANPPAVTIGHASTGTTLVLDSQNVDLSNGDETGSDPIYSQLSTNATNGAVINLRSNHACGGLSADGGATCAIPPIGDTADIITAGTAEFGMFVSESFDNIDTGAATGDIIPSSVYHDPANVDESDPTQLALGMDNSTATAAVGGSQRTYSGSVSGPFGSMIASSSGPTYRIHNRYIFGATASLTTPAGIYTANLTMTATGTF